MKPCTFLALILCASITEATAQPAAIRELIIVYHDLNGMCRGEPGDKRTIEACAVRDKLDGAITKLGYCYAKKGQTGGEARWHRCTRDSAR